MKIFLGIFTVLLLANLTYTQSIIDENCETDSDCLADSFLFCNHWKTCACTQGLNLRFDHDTQKCALDVGSDCYKEIPEPVAEPICYTDSECYDYDTSPPGKGKCLCNHGFVRNGTNRNCEAKTSMVGDICDPIKPPNAAACVENSSCTKSETEEIFKCQCNPGWTAEESKEGAMCISTGSGTITLLPGIVSVTFGFGVFALLYI